MRGSSIPSLSSIDFKPDLSIGINLEAPVSVLLQKLNGEFETRKLFDYLKTWYTDKTPNLERPLIFKLTEYLSPTFPFVIVSEVKWVLIESYV